MYCFLLPALLLSPQWSLQKLGQIVAILDALAKAGVAFVATKENIRIEGQRDIQTKVMTTLFTLFAEVERDLISERTREGLAQARASGRKLGRPKGSLGVSRLNGKEGRYPDGSCTQFIQVPAAA